MILVTGGTGHTGSRLVLRLLERGDQVRVLTREPLRIAPEIRKKLVLLRGDLLDAADARDAMAGCSAVIAMTHIKFAEHLITAMKETGGRRGIFTSSTRRFTRFPEETAKQVIEGEEAVRSSGLDWTILRASMIYGGAHDNNMERLVGLIRRFPIHPLINGGQMKWQPVFTHDVVAAIIAALDNPIAIGKEYTLAGPEPITYRQMVETIARGLNRKVTFVPVPIGAAKSMVSFYQSHSKAPRIRVDQIQRLEEDKTFDISDAQRDLNYSPVSFEEGIRRKLEGKA